MSLERIRTLPIFDGLTPHEFEEVSASMTAVTYNAGQTIARQDEDVNAPLIMAWAGTIRVLKHAGQPSEQILANIAAPTIVGELELITDYPMSAALVAVDEVRAFTLERRRFHELRDAGHPGLAKMVFNMAKTLAARLYRSNMSLA